MKKIYIFYLLLLLFFSLETKAQLSFSPNRGQWDNRILYRIPISQGHLIIDGDGFIFDLNDVKTKQNHNHNSEEKSTKTISGQIIHSKFIGNTWKNEIEEQNLTKHYYNYFLNNDPSKWKTEVYDVRKLILKDFYNDINLILKANNDDVEFNFEIKNPSSINQIKIEISGTDKVFINKNGDLIINSRFGEIVYSKPVAWQENSNKKRLIPIEFSIDKNIIQFNILGSSFNPSIPIYIDPSISFSTFTGSTSDNWGMTATPDNLGNLYAAGIVFDNGGNYPTTSGVYDSIFNGGEVYTPQPYYGFDVAISKFNSDGTKLLYGTYLGGSGNETPHSLVVDSQNNLYVMGATSSVDFPTSINGYDKTFNGGIPALNNNLYFSASDIYITKLSEDGSKLLAGTFIGGSDNDGMSGGQLEYNYGDAFRGEIIFGNDNNIYISSTTNSTDFPIKNGFQTNLKGRQDAVIFKLNEDLSQLSWSSYFGGSNEETGNSIQQSSSNDIYVVGGTTSTDLGVPFLGGISDGYIIKINGNSGNLVNQKLIGGSEYDQIYFVQLGTDDKVYIYGQSNSQMTITNGKYGIPNSGQFIQKLTADLNITEWTTKVGAGSNDIEISPTAFLVSNCNEIYISGWGGDVNVYHGKAIHSSTNDFPVTNDAFQSATNGSNFYIAVYAPDMDSLTYATFMGGTNSSFCHVDGGTSRFDSNGNIYHAVCAACGGNPNGFTTTPGVYSEQNKSSNCNLAAFKFELSQIVSDITILSPNICTNNPEVFYATNTNGNNFYWDFGDGSFSYMQNPTHTYSSAGKYIVKLTVGNSNNCTIGKTISQEIEVLGDNFSVAPINNPLCKNEQVFLNAYGGMNYEWYPHFYFNNYTIENPNFTAIKDDSIFVIISNNCYTDTFGLSITLTKNHPVITSDTSICNNQNVRLEVTNAKSTVWEQNNGILDTISNIQNVSPTSPTYYNVTITNLDDCIIDTFIFVNVIQSLISEYIPSNLKNINLCIGNQVLLDVNNLTSQIWSPGNYLNDPYEKNPLASPTNSTIFYVEGISLDGCPIKDSLTITIYKNLPKSNFADTIYGCKYRDMLININSDSTDFFSYQFSNSTINQLDSNIFEFNLNDTSKLICEFQNICGSIFDSTLYIPIQPIITIGPDTTLCSGKTLNLFATGAKTYKWYRDSVFIGNNSDLTITTTNNPVTYYVIGFDSLTCSDSASLTIQTNPSPQVFAMNDYLAAVGETIILTALGSTEGYYDWYSQNKLICSDCLPAYVQPDEKTLYTVEFTDTNQCKAIDSVLIYYDGVLYIPNTFTPSTTSLYNNFFKVLGYNITNYEIVIFDRWGEIVFTSNNIEEGWNGEYNNKPCQIGTYTWKVSYSDVSGNTGEKIGHVNLIR